jgi:hypothetical protein
MQCDAIFPRALRAGSSGPLDTDCKVTREPERRRSRAINQTTQSPWSFLAEEACRVSRELVNLYLTRMQVTYARVRRDRDRTTCPVVLGYLVSAYRCVALG